MKKSLKINFSKTRNFPEIDYYFKCVIRRAVEATLSHEKFPYDAIVSVTLCDADYIRALNKTYRGKDKPTDVLSFPIYEDGNFDMNECISGALLGDVVISIPRAREQAKEVGNPFLKEIAFLTVHSVLHLLGYDHERSADEDELQCRLQREICDSFEV
jgi:probable rRNA maturation factor